ncbi:hydroxyisourate hydrolase [Pullulanibacillus sp. KACC 23026]|uniref:hydroxyisourate hydrolase n=1 Tax=Pullulanibacillus sp. KACC 23026 TaxID=3028315 RepID=UPI0023AF1091|nr:hydroxyisourate hydrolase [Pullulanibacillus sp. KACC 23026]WEG13483.1 hydroxyisourate hydrolase [Pullulanibacillus sp. KACC 23026]
MTGLTTHILDLTHGKPAAHVTVELYFLETPNGGRRFIRKAFTNSDGRIDAPLLASDEMEIGTYELVFNIGDYFRETAIPLTAPPFLDQVPIRFGISDLKAHYHIPLLVSPYGYQTYRGS